ncbi:Carboxypeptidase [Trichostrongylus colubriformis]|uniref:Carboxypeptidase n=2 Tax=Trichostrongylus colubriformis TaxID=6319 RepID=A0AAN8F2V1_TRICO
MRLSVLPLILISCTRTWSIGEDDIVNLPGLQFVANFNTYSGYLNANDNGTWQMHYMLTESRSDPSSDPLIVWFNGGPGCSSYVGLFEELGPFYVNYDGESLYENVYAWNTKANVLYLESPIGVGFSYDTSQDSYSTANDDQTAAQNYAALKDFFIRVQPKFINRTFFLAGESYAGVYVPMLSKLLVKGINEGNFPNRNFQGAAIGNGFMHVRHLSNSIVLWSAYHGRVQIDDWDRIKIVCKTGNESDVEKYDFTQFMTSQNGMDFYADNSSECGRLIAPLISRDGFFGYDYDSYNYYQDCYQSTYNIPTNRKRLLSTAHRRRRAASNAYVFDGTSPLGNNAAILTNRISTDNQWGYPCWADYSLFRYTNNRAVQDALHVPDGWRKQKSGEYKWHDCNDQLYDQYHIMYNTTNDFFQYVIQNVKTPNFRFLVYNGDVDTACNYLGDSWFIRDVAKENNLKPEDRIPWFFSENNQLAGFVQRYTGKGGQGIKVSVDVLTVKGAGHMVPNDRPGPSVQMITNFLFPGANGVNYTSTAHTNPQPDVAPMKAAAGLTLLSAIISLIAANQ